LWDRIIFKGERVENSWSADAQLLWPSGITKSHSDNLLTGTWEELAEVIIEFCAWLDAINVEDPTG
jgi:hypothetical protein